MAMPYLRAVLFVSFLCFSSLTGIAHSHDDHFFVEGQVYCDTCRVQFITRVSEFMSGAKVRLECKDREGGHITYSIDGETDDSGTYHLPVDGNHEDEICEVELMKSSNPECDEIHNNSWANKSSSRISLTHNNGMSSKVRHANPLGFYAKEAHSECPEVFKELGILPNDP
ncbi:hypothetical protein RJ639_011529 [Escallonia herrerae]|uniref:Olee1-like protein n=1 Tax=Escallonia herrerae TaxID=1293975 RepID=A0AA88VR35_9ASTE|nr:hypothetical protein RJ639_011529 [Escallonia herrerae]